MNQAYKIDIIVGTKRSCPKIKVLKEVAAKTLDLEGIRNNVALNILLTDNEGIRRLNREFLQRDEPTDVISFGMGKKGFIGEIAISVEMAEYNAGQFNTSEREELFLYIIHGILHLLGYKDKTNKESRSIQDRQDKILKTVCGQETS